MSDTFSLLEKRIKITTQIDIKSLCFFRIVFGLFTILFFWPSYGWIADVPDAFFNPPFLSFASLFSKFPSSDFFLVIDIGIIVSVVSLTIGLFTRVSTGLLFILVLVGNSFQYSFGKIDHGTLLYLCVLLIMSFKEWGRFLSVDSFRKRQHLSLSKETQSGRTDLSLLGILIAFGFFTAGYGKALHWVDFDLSTSGVLFWLYGGYFTVGRDELLAPLAMQIESPWLWEMADLSAVLFELSFLIAIFQRRVWYIWLTIACGFHLINCLLFNITFIVQAAAYLTFIPWSSFAFVRHMFIKHQKGFLLAIAGFCTCAVIVKVAFSGRTGILFLLVNKVLGASAEIQISALFWLLLVLLFIASFRHLSKGQRQLLLR